MSGVDLVTSSSGALRILKTASLARRVEWSVNGIPGVRGVGPKTAAKWLREYGSPSKATHWVWVPLATKGVVVRGWEAGDGGWHCSILIPGHADDYHVLEDPEAIVAEIGRQRFEAGKAT